MLIEIRSGHLGAIVFVEDIELDCRRVPYAPMIGNNNRLIPHDGGIRLLVFVDTAQRMTEFV
jgi:hypothetical protein